MPITTAYVEPLKAFVLSTWLALRQMLLVASTTILIAIVLIILFIVLSISIDVKRGYPKKSDVFSG